MDNRPHNIEEQKKVEQKFVLDNEEVKIIGFWVNEVRMGKLTHPDKHTHLQFFVSSGDTSD